MCRILWVLAAGKVPPNPSALLGSETMAEVISALRESADWIIVETRRRCSAPTRASWPAGPTAC